ncbi:MAG: hypothetical protein UU21_C0025G0001, partial [Candidatus Levybacteria bacterium GW2011_GWA2_40_8]
SGDNPSNFGSSATLNPNILNVDRLSSGEPFAPVIPRTIRTSYNYILANVRQAKAAERTLPCANPLNCTLGGSAATRNLPAGVYVVNGSLNLTLSNPNNVFTQGNYVILVRDDVVINSEIHLDSDSGLVISAGRDITVASNVGTNTYNSTTPNLEGIYSAGRNFVVAGNNNCSLGSDRKLNVLGNIIANAALNGGQVVLQRTLCSSECAAFYVQPNLNLLLRIPGVIKVPSYIWKEVAP